MQQQNAKSMQYRKTQQTKFGLPVAATGCTRHITASLLTVHMCMACPCHSFVDGLS